jgi:tetratricopeptide (TPR) repeat protein
MARGVAASLVAVGAMACTHGEPAPPPPQPAVAAPAAPRARLDEVQRLSSLLRYQEAIAEFEAVKAQHPDEVTALDGLKMVVVLAEVGDIARHNALTRWLVERHRSPRSATDAERSVKGYIVFRTATDPDLVAHAVEMTRYASEHAAADGEGQYQGFFDTSRGIAEYRAGRFAEAAKWFRTTTDHQSLFVRTLSLPFSAMTELARGNRKQAQALLERARRAAADLPKPGTETYGIEWTDTLISNKVMEEAEAAFTSGT